MRIIPTNKRLMKYNIKPSNFCEFCNMDTERLKHLFWECTHTQHFWTRISNYFKDINLNLNLNYQTIALGIAQTTSIIDKKAIESIILFAKYYIYKKKCLSELPVNTEFIIELQHNIELERIIAFKNDKLTIHENKWRTYIQNINT